MKKKLLTLIPYIVIFVIDFYLIPFCARDTGTAMILMLGIMPVIAFISAVIYGVRNGFSIILPISALVLFIPSIFIHYNSSALIYAAVYAVAVLVGNVTGRLFYMKK